MTVYRIPKALTIFIVLLLSMSVFAQWWAIVDGDKFFLVYVTHQWLNGKRLYADLFEVTPPLVWGLYSVPITLAEWTGVRESNVLFVFWALCCCVSVLLTHRLLTRHAGWNASLSKAHILFLAAIFVVWPNPAHFGDRDHLFLVMIFPYLVRWMPSLRRTAPPLGLRVTAGLFAAVGFCIKPYCMLLFITAQLLVLLGERSLKYLFAVENIIIAGFAAAYLAVIAVLTPEYITRLLPVAFATYAENNMGIGQLSFYAMSAFFLMIPLADFRLRYISLYRRDILYQMGLCAGFLAYILLGNGWAYTFYPFDAMVLYLTGWLWLEFRTLEQDYAARGLPVKPFIFGARACITNMVVHILYVMALYTTAWMAVNHPGPPSVQQRINEDMAAVVRAEHSRSFGVMSATFGPWPVLARATGAKPQTRFSTLWMIPKFLLSGEEFSQSHEWIIRFVAEAYAQDLNKNQPDVIFVDAGPEFYNTGKPAPLLAWFSRYPDFTQAWSHYALLTSVNHCDDADLRKAIHKQGCRYDVYRRTALRAEQ